MPSTPDVPDALRRLAALGSRDDLNLRPVLLRVATDLFVMKDHHAPEEVRQFQEIALHMLDQVDAETRVMIAGKLAAHGGAPAAIIERLIACGGETAAVVLEKTSAIGARTLVGAACFGDAATAAAVARRADLAPELVQALAARAEPVVLVALAENRSAAISRRSFLALVRRARTDLRLAAALLARTDDFDDLAPLFLAADSDQRAAIILAAKRRALGRPRQVAPPADTALLARLEKLAAQPNRRPFAAMLAAATGARIEDMGKVVDDRSGEPLALVLSALGITPAAATRIFLMGDPEIAHSYPRIAALHQLVADMNPHMARRLVAHFLDLARESSRTLAATDPTASATPSRSGRVPIVARPRGTLPTYGHMRRLADHSR
jgi:uncharacterized protein (DUF2336 family)